MQNLVVIVLLVILALFIGIGLFNVDMELYQPFAPQGWLAAVGVIGLIIVIAVAIDMWREEISLIFQRLIPSRNP